jgi:hypothetical protein
MRAKALTASIIAAFALVAADAAVAQQRARDRQQSMEQCVGSVLGRLVQAKAPETEVGPTVVSQCDGPLRARIAAEIARGRARDCPSVESCIDKARQQTAEAATQAYRDMSQSQK